MNLHPIYNELPIYFKWISKEYQFSIISQSIIIFFTTQLLINFKIISTQFPLNFQSISNQLPINFQPISN